MRSVIHLICPNALQKEWSEGQRRAARRSTREVSVQQAYWYSFVS